MARLSQPTGLFFTSLACPPQVRPQPRLLLSHHPRAQGQSGASGRRRFRSVCGVGQQRNVFEPALARTELLVGFGHLDFHLPPAAWRQDLPVRRRGQSFRRPAAEGNGKTQKRAGLPRGRRRRKLSGPHHPQSRHHLFDGPGGRSRRDGASAGTCVLGPSVVRGCSVRRAPCCIARHASTSLVALRCGVAWRVFAAAAAAR